MNILGSSLGVVVPLFIMLLAGALLRRFGLMPDALKDGASKLVYTFFLPCMLFSSIVNSGGIDATALQFILVSNIGILIAFALIMVFSKLFIKDETARGAFSATSFRPNTAIYGFPLIASFLGAEMVPAVMTLLSPVILVSNILTVIALELSRARKKPFGQIAKSILLSPVVLSMFLGFLFKIIGISLSEMIMSPIDSFKDVTTPLAFLVLGATFTFKSAYKNRKFILFASLIKLVLPPLLFILPAIFLFDYSGMWVVALLCVFATPSAVTTFSMVRELGADSELAGEIITFTTLFSLITIFLFSVWFQSMGVL